MGYDKVKIKQIAKLMCLAAALVLVLIYSGSIVKAAATGVQYLSPFIVGAVIAFILKLPMNWLENIVFRKWQGKSARALKRPVCMILSLVFVLMLVTVLLLAVIPQVSQAIVMLGNQIPAATEDLIDWIIKVARDYPQLEEEVQKLAKLEINWERLGQGVVNFVKNGFGNVVSSTVNVASSIISGLVNAFISFIFAFYILGQKEKLAGQGKRLLSAYLPEAAYERVICILNLLNRNFSKFITGQCLEAVILGTLFVIFMSIFRMPYAMMIGVLIAFTALIPVVGAFIGCGVGAFLILIENPMQALVFVIMFLVIQQLEGNLIYPRVVGNSVGLPSIWVLMAVSLGGSLFGVSGMLTFIPLLSTVYTLLREGVDVRQRKKREAAQCGEVRQGEEPTQEASQAEAAVNEVMAEEGKEEAAHTEDKQAVRSSCWRKLFRKRS